MTKRKAPLETLLEMAKAGDHNQLKEELEVLPTFVDINRLKDNLNRNLFHLAIGSESVDCVRVLLENGRVDIDVMDADLNTPLMHAIKYNTGTEIIKLIIDWHPNLINVRDTHQMYPFHYAMKKFDKLKVLMEKAIEKNVLLNEYIDYYQRNLIIIAVDELDLNVLQYIIKNTLSDVNFIYHRRNAFQHAVQYDNKIKLPKILDLLYQHIYGKIMGFHFDLLETIFELLSRRDGANNFEWFIENIYLHHTNNLCTTVSTLLQFSTDYHINVNKIIFYLHSDFRRKKLYHINFTIHMNDCYKILFEIFINNRNLFDAIINEMHIMWRRHYMRFRNYEITDFPLAIIKKTFKANNYQNIDETFRNIVEYFDKINLQDFLIATRIKNMGFQRWHIPMLMPFIAVPNADDLISGLRIMTYEELIFAPIDIKGYCGYYFNDTAMSLQMLCRNTIRKAIFKRNSTNTAKIKKLRSLEIPIPLKNYLFYNHTKYNMFAKK